MIAACIVYIVQCYYEKVKGEMWNFMKSLAVCKAPNFMVEVIWTVKYDYRSAYYRSA